MSKAKQNVAVLTAEAGEIMANKYELPVNIITALDSVGEGTKILLGNIQALSEELSAALGDDWYQYAGKGDIRDEAAPVEEMRKKMQKYYVEQLEHSNFSTVWTRAQDYARTALEGEPEDETNPNANRAKAVMVHLFGNGAYAASENKKAVAFKLYRRLSLARDERTANPALNEFMKHLAAGIESCGYSIEELTKAAIKTK